MRPSHFRYSPLYRCSSTRLFSTASTHPIPSEPLPPPSKSQHHHDLPSFLDYASRSSLSLTSTTYIGTHYEYVVLSALRRLGFSMTRIGGRSDYGIDLLGDWTLPNQSSTSTSTPSSAPPQKLKVLAQCKAISRPPGPNLIRELEGAFPGAPVGWRGQGVLGLLIAKSQATKGVREALGRSRWPLGFMLCTKDGVLQQFLWNKVAEQEGLQGWGIGVRYVG